MIVRSLDVNGDWEFGAGLNNYKRNNLAVAQEIQTRVSSFLGDCFFDMGAGINWFFFLSSKDETGLNLAISAAILNTSGVTGISQLGFNLSRNRVFSVSYQVITIYSVTGGDFQFDLGGAL
jgi:hypothetical protein